MEKRRTRQSDKQVHEEEKHEEEPAIAPWTRLWIRMQGFPPWPALVIDPKHPDVPENVRMPERWSTKPQCIIQWFGTGDFSRMVVDPKTVVEFDGASSEMACNMRDEFSRKKTWPRGHGQAEWDAAVAAADAWAQGIIPRAFVSPRKSVSALAAWPLTKSRPCGQASSPAAAKGHKRAAETMSDYSPSESDESPPEDAPAKPKAKPAATHAAAKRPRATPREAASGGTSSSGNGSNLTVSAAALRAYNSCLAMFPKMRRMFNGLEEEVRKAAGGGVLDVDGLRAALEEERHMRCEAEESQNLMAITMTRAREDEETAKEQCRRLRLQLRSALERLAAATGQEASSLPGWSDTTEPVPEPLLAAAFDAAAAEDRPMQGAPSARPTV